MVTFRKHGPFAWRFKTFKSSMLQGREPAKGLKSPAETLQAKPKIRQSVRLGFRELKHTPQTLGPRTCLGYASVWRCKGIRKTAPQRHVVESTMDWGLNALQQALIYKAAISCDGQKSANGVRVKDDGQVWFNVGFRRLEIQTRIVMIPVSMLHSAA